MSNNTQQSSSWLSDPKEVKKGYLGIAAISLALAPFTGGASIVYGLGQAAFLGVGASMEQDRK